MDANTDRSLRSGLNGTSLNIKFTSNPERENDKEIDEYFDS